MTPTGSAPGAYFRKQDWAYDQVREYILRGTIAAGARIDQEVLAKSLNISRIPLREALSRLQAEGWLDGSPHRRLVVPMLSLDGARDIYTGRGSLEPTLAARAASRGPHGELSGIRALLDQQRVAFAAGDMDQFRTLDRDFHMSVYDLAQIPQTLKAAAQLYALGARYVRLYLGTPDRSGASLSEHADILEAVEQGDAARAEELTRTHIMHGLDVLHSLLPSDTPSDTETK